MIRNGQSRFALSIFAIMEGSLDLTSNVLPLTARCVRESCKLVQLIIILI